MRAHGSLQETHVRRVGQNGLMQVLVGVALIALVVPLHRELKRGTLAGILRDEGFPVTIVAEGFAGLRAIGMTDEQLEAMIELVHAGAAGAEHPARVDEPAVRAILTGALAGDRPLRSPVAEAA